jgi:glycosyltransferase involved in cell wall biosynthesis
MESQKFKASIIVPAYKEAESIQATAKSLATQTLKNIELILVSNGESKNNQTAQIAESEGFKVIYSEKGVANARQKGLEEANGEFVLNCDADSLYPDVWAERMIQFMEEGGHLAVTGLIEYLTSSQLIKYYQKSDNLSRIIRSKIGLPLTGISECNMGFHRETALKAGGFDTSRNYAEGVSLLRKPEFYPKGNIPLITDPEVKIITSDRRIRQIGIRGTAWQAIKQGFAEITGRGRKAVNQYPNIRNSPPPD